MKQFFSLFVCCLLGYNLTMGQICPDTVSIPTSPTFTLTAVGTYATGVFDESATEVVAYDPVTKRLFSTNSDAGSVDIVDISDVTNPTLIKMVDLTTVGDGATSVAVYSGIVAVSVPNNTGTEAGFVVFMDTDGNISSQVTVGVLPDMLTFTPDGTKVLTANEGEPNDEYTIDPEGSVSIIDLSGGVATLTDANVTNVSFTSYNDSTLDASVRIFGPGATIAQDLEPEFITLSDDSQTAYVACQENNALVVIDVETGTVSGIVGLGFKDHSLDCNGFDASNRDTDIEIQSWPTLGMYQPDAIKSFTVGGNTYIISANEGDARDYDGYSEETRVEDLTLDPTSYPNAAFLQDEENLGRLKTTTATGDTDGDGDIDQIYSYGARSFSIWDAAGNLIWDSGEDFEQIVAALQPTVFNSSNDETGFKNRSDDKGPEPEAVEVAILNDNIYAFIGLERHGGIMVYNITNPMAPVFEQFINNRDFDADPETAAAGDLGPESILFIPASTSPNGMPLIAVANEVSGTVTLFEIGGLPALVCDDIVEIPAEPAFSISVAGTYATGVFDESATEIVAFDPATQRLFSTNSDAGSVDIIDASDINNPTLIKQVDLTTVGDGATSVAVNGDIVAVSVPNNDETAAGSVVFMDTDGNIGSQVTVGVLPDMLTFTPDGTKILVANEGQPNDNYDVDPEGSVSIIDVSGGVESISDASVTTVSFTTFNDAILDESVRIFGPGATVAQDLEPEYIALSDDSKTAYVACQENNALVVIDVDAGTVSAIVGLGFKDHSLPCNGLDASNRDDEIEIRAWPTLGMYQPDAIKSFSIGGETYILSANEGDARDYDGYSEEVRVKDLNLDPTAYPNAVILQEDENLGRLKTTTATGDTDGDGDIDQIYSYGARSFSIWNSDGELVWDSGEDFEQIIAALEPDVFNSSNDETGFKDRSDDKGPEPEAIEVALLNDRMYAFIGMERHGGIMVYDVSNPMAPVFEQFINNRNFDADPETAEAGDLGPESILFISAENSPSGTPVLAVANEVSGTVTIFEIGGLPALVCEDTVEIPAVPTFNITPVGTYATGVFDESAAEIVAYDPATKRIFSTNSDAGSVDIVDATDVTNPTLVTQVDLTTVGDGATSVAVFGGIVAVSVPNDDETAAGSVVFMDTDGNIGSQVTVGVLPDMITFTPDGTKLLTANEGQPNDNYDVDPEGSVSIIDVSGGIESISNDNVTTVSFASLNGTTLDESVRIFGPGATVAQDLEPEYIALSGDSKTAYVALQENNALAVIDVEAGSLTGVVGLGFKDHSMPCNGLDASNRDDEIEIRAWPTLGMYQPDAIKSYVVDGETYILSANEGDSRDYDGYSEEVRVKDLNLDPTAYPNALILQEDENLGRLKTTTATGDTDGDGDIDQIYSYGARSFSIWNSAGELVWDSGEDFEQIVAALEPAVFNSSNDETGFKDRSDDKGPEPEAVEIAQIGDKSYAFIGLERHGGIMVYDITDPLAPVFEQFVNNRDFDADPESPEAGDLGPESILFVPADLSPSLTSLIIVANEVSGTVTLFEISGTQAVSLTPSVNPSNKLVAYPNPFTQNTTISVEAAQAGKVVVDVYSLSGQLVETVFDGYMNANQEYSFDLQAENLAGGMYLMRMVTENSGIQVRKLILNR
ncbi:MAG: choice-of-anchor I family protein [Bacteroidota bacterium]